MNVRERRLVFAVLPPLLILLLYMGLWYPFSQSTDRLQQVVSEQKQTIVWMMTAADQVKQLRQQGGEQAQARGQSLLSLADSSARQIGLQNALKRVEPDGNDKVKIRFEQTVFDDLVRWLEQLHARYGVYVETISLDKQEQPGIVNGRLTLKRAGV